MIPLHFIQRRDGAARAQAMLLAAGLFTFAVAACSGPEQGGTSTTEPPPPPPPPPPARVPFRVAGIAGTATRIDLATSATNLNARLGPRLIYRVTMLSGPPGLRQNGGIVEGTVTTPGVVRAIVDATNVTGDSARDTLVFVAFSSGLPSPELPASPHAYSNESAPLPRHLAVFPTFPGTFGRAEIDSAARNPITDDGATLGRVLFYDTRLSVNDEVSCGSCHRQSLGFADTGRVSVGVFGRRGTRRAMPLANLRFTTGSGFFWDQRAGSLEELALMPLVNRDEMGTTVDDVVAKVALTDYYAPLFERAFGSRDVNASRIARAIAQYLRSLTPINSRFDAAFPNGALVADVSRLSERAQRGLAVFGGNGCATCHFTSAHVLADAANNGLDAVPTDPGFVRGMFRSPSLRNVAIRPPYMHDGRFKTLAEVIDFYDRGIKDSPDLDRRLRDPGTGVARRMNLTASDRGALEAFLESLTDSTFLTAPKFADPFPRRVGGAR